jgi:hypothetical protein
MKDELYQFLACDYYGTGEGRIVYLLITRAYPWSEDYEDYVLTSHPPQYPLKNTAKFRAAREFTIKFGGFATQGVENLPREEFLKRYGHYLPDMVRNILTSEEQPGNLNYSQEFHLNFS